jgi:hypothetical protein
MATVYICAVIGKEEGYFKDSITVLAVALNNPAFSEISPKKSGDLLSDAFKWYKTKKYSKTFTMDFNGYWYELCETPMNNLRLFTK